MSSQEMIEVDRRLRKIEALVTETHRLVLLDTRFGSADKRDEYLNGYNERMSEFKYQQASGSCETTMKM